MELAAEIIDIHKYYFLGDNTVKALNGVSLEIPKGDFLAIMGSSGSGKSTLLNLLGALDRPTKGQYILGSHDVSQLDDDQLSAIRNQMIGFIFQSYNLIAQYTVLENIEVPLHYGPSPLPTEKSVVTWPTKWGSATGLTIVPFSCPAGSSSELPSRVLWPTIRKSSSPTNRPVTWTRQPNRKSWTG